MRTETKALLVAAIISIAIEPANWIIGRILDAWADTPPSWLQGALWVYEMIDLPSYLFVGFGIGVLITLGVSYLHRSRRDVVADRKLADELDDLAQEFINEHAHLERVRQERHWEPLLHMGNAPAEDIVRDAWTKARIQEANELERIKKRLWARLEKVIAQLLNRHIKLDLWWLGAAPDIKNIGRDLMTIAGAMRNGTYLDRSFPIGKR